MMASSGISTVNTEELTSSTVFSDFTRTCEFPSYVIVTGGNYLSRSVQVSERDVLLLKSLEERRVTLTYLNSSNQYTEVCVPLVSDMKFNVLSPKETEISAKRSSVIMYPTISDLLIDCPTYFEATTPYDDPYLPGLSIRSGERFRFVKKQETKEGTVNLEVINDKGTSLILTSGCRGNFCPVQDPQEYSLKELIELAPVQRCLMLVTSEKPNDSQESKSAFEEQETAHASSNNPVWPTQSSFITKDTSVESNDTHNESHVSLLRDSETSNSPGSSSLVTPTAEDKDSRGSFDNHDLDLVAVQNISSLDKPTSITEGVSLDSIPPSTVLHLLTPEKMVRVSPYRDSGTSWQIPVSANLLVQPFTPSDYEVPQVNRQNRARTQIPLPLPPLSPNGDMPSFKAPSTPPIPQPLVPLNINSFADIYSGSLPAKSKLLDISKCDKFWQKALDSVYDLDVLRLEEENRLYVKDYKSDDVYSLSQDLDISFLEYPEKFSEVSELLQLPIGSELTILEDIASDYPKPISLKFGDVLRICTNTPQFVKLKYGNRDCEVLKVEKFDPGGNEPTKLKLPIDFEVQMTMSTSSGTLRPVSLSKILWGSAPVPPNVVAMLPGDEENQMGLPSDVMILRPMKQAVLVVASNRDTGENARMLHTSASFSCRQGFGNSSDLSGGDMPECMGLPLSCGAVLAFQGRRDLCDMNVEQFNALFLRIPVEKLTMGEFEERERLRKLNSDYEDIAAGRDGSDLCVNECGAQVNSLHRTLSAGVLDRREKKSKIDKVRRLSRALNPKHWRQPRQEPEPLPHPSAMGLMALAARPPSGQLNDYHHEQIEKSNSLHSGSTNTEVSSDDEETENLYEDVEIGPIKSATMESQPSTNPGKGRSGPFSGFLHKSLPSPRRDRRQHVFNKTPPWDTTGEFKEGINGPATHTNVRGPRSAKEAHRETPSQDAPKSASMDKAMRWASKLGDKIQQARHDIPRISKSKDGIDGSKGFEDMTQHPFVVRAPCTSSAIGNGYSARIGIASSPPSDRAPSPPLLPPPRNGSLGIQKDSQTHVKGNDDASRNDGPVAPARRRRAPAAPLQAPQDAVSTKKEILEDLPSTKDPVTNQPVAPCRNESSSTVAKMGTNNVKIQPAPRKSLLQMEKKIEAPCQEDRESTHKAVPPKPKPRGIKSQKSTEPIVSPSVAIKSMETPAIKATDHRKEEEREDRIKQKRVAPPIKPRTT